MRSVCIIVCMWFKSLVSYHTISMSNLKYATLHMLFYVGIKNEKSIEILNSCIFIAFNTLYRIEAIWEVIVKNIPQYCTFNCEWKID